MKRHVRAALFSVPFLALAPLLAGAEKINTNVNQDTFVLSNEGPGFLIAKLINAGHGADSVYQATVFLASLPGAGAVLTPAFLNALATEPAGSQIFTTTLTQVLANGVSVSISTDGTVRFDGIQASTFAGIYPVIQTGNGTVQNVRIVHSTDSAAPLNATVIDGPLVGMTTTYKAFAVAWALADSPVATPTLSQWSMLLLAGMLAGAAALQLRRRAARVSTTQR